MGLFDFKNNKKNNLDFSKVLNDDMVSEFIKSGQLKWVYIIAPIFGGSKERGNQIVVTPEAAEEKQAIDEELVSFLEKGISVENFHIDFKYKEKSVVPSKMIITAIIDKKSYNKVIEIW